MLRPLPTSCAYCVSTYSQSASETPSASPSSMAFHIFLRRLIWREKFLSVLRQPELNLSSSSWMELRRCRMRPMSISQPSISEILRTFTRKYVRYSRDHSLGVRVYSSHSCATDSGHRSRITP